MNWLKQIFRNAETHTHKEAPVVSKVGKRTEKAVRMVAGLAAIAAISACSTTKLLPEGTYRLVSNKVSVEDDSKLNSSELTPYIRQQANSSFLGMSLGVSIYNWSNGSGKGINRFWEKLGTPPVVFDESEVDSSVENMLNYMTTLGYYNASIEPEIKYKRRKAKVTYNVYAGSRYTIDEIVYDIPEGGTFEQDFYADTARVSIKPGDFLSEDLLEAETERGATHFRNLGYYDFNKNNYFFEADTLGDKTILHYRIKGYTRNETPSEDVPITKYRIDSVSIWYPSNIRLNESMVKKFNIIRPGSWYNERNVNTTYYRYSALNLFNNVNIEMTPTDSSKVNCDIRLMGTDMTGFKLNAEVSTNSSGLLGLSPQFSFFHKNLFHGGERLNIGFTGNWQFNPSTNVRATEVGISANLSIPRSLGYSVEKIRGRNIPRTEFVASYNYQNRPEYTRSVAGFSYGYSGQIRTRVFYQIYPIQMNYIKLYNISSSFSETITENPYLADTYQDQIDFGTGMTLYYTTDASIVPKGPYGFIRLSFDTAGNLLSLFDSWLPMDEDRGSKLLLGVPYNQYVRLGLTFGKVFRFGRNDGHALAFRLDGGIGRAYGNSTALPFEKQFYVGGASSMRGWQVRTLGPGFDEQNDSFVIPSQTGNVKLEADLEYRFKMFWKLEGALFAEAGNVWMMEYMLDQLPASIAADWGLGIRVNLNFILLRIDAGFKVRDPSRAEGRRWLSPGEWFKSDGAAIHFGVGYPF